MAVSRVEQWFGARFGALHPWLQSLHLHGGQLIGPVDVDIPTGVAGVFGRRLAKALGVPHQGGQHHFQVTISHQVDGMHWDRCFDNASVMQSLFQPVGVWPDGYWLEVTGPLQMRLTVDVKDGGWHWRCLEIRLCGWRMPMWLFPNSRAFKTIDEGHYTFFVGFSLPGLGTILSYSGCLSPSPPLAQGISLA